MVSVVLCSSFWLLSSCSVLSSMFRVPHSVFHGSVLVHSSGGAALPEPRSRTRNRSLNTEPRTEHERRTQNRERGTTGSLPPMRSPEAVVCAIDGLGLPLREALDLRREVRYTVGMVLTNHRSICSLDLSVGGISCHLQLDVGIEGRFDGRVLRGVERAVNP